MKKVLAILGVVLILVFLADIYMLYEYAGLKYYIRAVSYIDKLPTQIEREASWTNLFGDSQGSHYGGILSGVTGNRVWVWGKSGLRSFVTDQYSVYSFYDGCTDLIINASNSAISSIDVVVPTRQTDFTLDAWSKKVAPGDMVMVLITAPANGGTTGNLREIYADNYWPFMQRDMITECAK